MIKTSEYEEAVAFHQWLNIKGIKHTHTPNETGSSQEARRRAVRMKRQGTSRGVPDYTILIDKSQSNDGEGYVLYLELKVVKGGTLSKEQKEWIDAINGLGVNNIQAYVAKGCDEAIKIVSHYLKVDSSPF